MATACEFLMCHNTSEDTKVNRLRIHENLARKWKQVFDESLDDRTGEYLYICGAHFDINTKKLILPKPTQVTETPKTVKKEVPQHESIKRKRVTDASSKPKSYGDVDSDDEPLVHKRKPVVTESFVPEQMFIEVEMDEMQLIPEIKQEIEEEIVHETQERERSPMKQVPDWKSLVPDTMKPRVVLSSNLETLAKSHKKKRDKTKYDAMMKELRTLQAAVDKAKMKNEFLQRDLVITRNRIKFVESNFGGAPSRRNV